MERERLRHNGEKGREGGREDQVKSSSQRREAETQRMKRDSRYECRLGREK